MPLTVGTAGHIDHGKTWLVRALTGKDTDRLPEEQRRGISIDLGYAPLELPDGRRLSLVDVPGHERFVRTMIAGATGIDLFLLVDRRPGGRSAADTRAPRGAAAARRRPRSRRRHEGRRGRRGDARSSRSTRRASWCPTAEVVAVSAKTGTGLDELRAALARVEVAERRPDAATRLYVDRVVHAPRRRARSRPERSGRERSPPATCCAVEPAGRTVRVRSVQVHDAAGRARRSRPTRRGQPPRRSSEPSSGAATCSSRPGTTRSPTGSTCELDAARRHACSGDRPRRHDRGRGAGRSQRRRSRNCGSPSRVVAARGDHVDPAHGDDGRRAGWCSTRRRRGGSSRHGSRCSRRGTPRRSCKRSSTNRSAAASCRHAACSSRASWRPGSATVRAAGEHYFSEALARRAARRACSERLAAQRELSPLDPGLPLAELLPAEPWAPHVANLLEVERRGAKALPAGRDAQPRRTGRGCGRARAQLAQDEIRQGRRQAARRRSSRRRDGCAASVTASPSRPRSTTAAEAALATLEPITLASFRDALGVGRRTAQLLLERYDADGLTLRRGDVRTLRRARGRGSTSA